MVDKTLCNDVLKLAAKLLAAARAGVQPTSAKWIPPPPPGDAHVNR